MTEFFILCSAAIAAILLVDPFFSGALIISPFAKTLVLVTGIGSLAFHLLGRAVMAPARLGSVFKDMVADWWPLLLLSVFVMLGSAWAVYVDGVKESFRGLGLGMLYLPMMALAVGAAEKPMLFMKGLATIHVLVVLTMLGMLFATKHLFHESIFVAVPLGAYFLCDRKTRFWQLVLGLALILSCAFSFKNTTFVMILVTLVACAFVRVVRMLRSRDRLTVITQLYFTVLVLAAAVAGLLYAYFTYRTELPSGNLNYRVEMYGIAWRRFLDSPLWGSAFTDASVNYFRLFKVDLGTQYLPTHSDILDILAQGGVIGIALWLGTVWRILAIGWSTVRELVANRPHADMRPWRWLFVLVLIQINAIVTYALNPPLINPVHGFWIWGSAGLMWALHRHLTKVPAAEPQAARRAGKAAWA